MDPVLKQLGHFPNELVQADVVPVVQLLPDYFQVNCRIQNLFGVFLEFRRARVVWQHEDHIIGVVVHNPERIPGDIHPPGKLQLVVYLVNLEALLQDL
jgi:hypothetical protein